MAWSSSASNQLEVTGVFRQHRLAHGVPARARSLRLHGPGHLGLPGEAECVVHGPQHLVDPLLAAHDEHHAGVRPAGHDPLADPGELGRAPGVHAVAARAVLAGHLPHPSVHAEPAEGSRQPPGRRARSARGCPRAARPRARRGRSPSFRRGRPRRARRRAGAWRGTRARAQRARPPRTRRPPRRASRTRRSSRAGRSVASPGARRPPPAASGRARLPRRGPDRLRRNRGGPAGVSSPGRTWPLRSSCPESKRV